MLKTRLNLRFLSTGASPATLMAALALQSLLLASAHAQSAIERHVPDLPRGPQIPLIVATESDTAADDTPLGVNLAGVALLGEREDVTAHPQSGISGAQSELQLAAIQTALKPLIGRPLSLALARDIQAKIAKAYRDSGYPLVSVTLPPQELTSGILQVRVIEFRAGTVTVTGDRGALDSALRSRLRVVEGEKVNATAMQEDLDWLNRSPYRRATGTFSPGEQTGLTNLSFAISRAKPWQIWAGWASSDSKTADNDRSSFGANFYIPDFATISYQMTGSRDLWADPSQLALKTGDFPDYLSQSGRILLPTFARQELEIAPALVASTQQVDTHISFENTTFELPVIYRSAVSNLLPGHYWGDIYGGVEYKSLHRRTLFNGIGVGNGEASLMQFVLGWSNDYADALGKTSLDLRLKMNPGGILSGSDADDWKRFTNGKVTDISYVYAAADITRQTSLPYDLGWSSSLSGVLAGQTLPDTERMSLSGLSAVRGYSFSDASADTGFVWRNELHLPAAKVANMPEGIDPFLFADVGSGHDFASKTNQTLASLGAGLNVDAFSHLSASLSLGTALTSEGETEAGDWAFRAALNARF